MTKRLRWKLKPAETGLSAVGAPPRGYVLHDGEIEYAHVNPNGGGWRSAQNGWYWVSYGPVPLMNTYGSPVSSADDAKKAARAYVDAFLKEQQQ